MMMMISRQGSPVCECNKGWGGVQCNQPICNPPCRYDDDDEEEVLLEEEDFDNKNQKKTMIVLQ